MPRLLATMSASGEGLRMRLILVDNASKDGGGPHFGVVRLFSRDAVLEKRPPPFLRRQLEPHPGAATARYVLLMNTDMYFYPRQQCLGRMAAMMDGRPDCGVAGCRLYHADGTDAYAARRFQTFPLVLAWRCGLGRPMRCTLDRHFYAEHAPDETFPCDWLSGRFLIVRREASWPSAASTSATARISRTWTSACGWPGRAGG